MNRLIMILVAFVFIYVNVAAQELYQPKLPKEKDFEKIKINLKEKLRSGYIYCRASSKLSPLQSDNLIPVNVEVFDDRFELTFRRKNTQTFYFKDLVDFNIRVSKDIFVHVNGVFGHVYKPIKLNSSIGDGEGSMTICTEICENNIADDLFYIRYQLMDKKIESWLNDFKPIAEKYRTLTEKPALTEEQREYIVQANLYAQQKKYNKAIELYQKVCQLNNYSFPAAYSNLALLCANSGDYQSAIYYMKLYLMLEPNASDARASQDKIYEWKTML